MTPSPPTTLSLTVPGNGSYSTGNRKHISFSFAFVRLTYFVLALYSPSSDGYYDTRSQDSSLLPSYGNSVLAGSEWSTKIDPTLNSPNLNTLEPSIKPPPEEFEERPESEVKIKDFTSSHHASTANMSPKQRAAHRKAIEEKSSLKRKHAEQRLSKAVTARLGGTFVPGLANQMNQAAEIIE
jgi:hypothetical protein